MANFLTTTHQHASALNPRLLLTTTVPQTLSFFMGHLKYLSERGYQVALVSSEADPATVSLQDTPPDIPHVHIAMSRGWKVISDALALRSWWILLDRYEPDIVHAATPKASLIATIAVRTRFMGRKRRPRLVVSVFGLPQMTRKGLVRAILNATTRLSTHLADAVWFDSRSTLGYALDAKLTPKERSIVLGNGSVGGVDAKGRFNPHTLRETRETVRHRLNVDEEELIIGFVGRITRDKGVQDLLEAFEFLQQAPADQPLHLLLAGPLENDSPQLLERAQALSNVHILPATSHPEELLSALDIFAMPSYREGFGVVNIEAAAMELPVVSTFIPGCIDSVEDGVTGTLVPPRDSRALAIALQDYVSNPDSRRAHGRAGRARALQQFSPTMLHEELQTLYESATN